MTVGTYEVNVTRDGRWWMIEIPAIDGLTQAHSIEEVEAMARDYIVVDQDLAPSKVRVEVKSIVVDGDDVLPATRALEKIRERIDRDEREFVKRRAELAGRLSHAEVSHRDAAKVLGVSRQRVGQMLSA